MGLGKRRVRVAVGLVVGALLPVAAVSATVSEASAACAPVALHGVGHVRARTTAVHARTAKVRVQRVARRRYVAVTTVTVRSGRATASAAQVVCPDGAAGAAVSSTQTRTAKGTATRTIRKRASTRAAAVGAARRTASTVRSKLRHRLAGKAGRKRAIKAAKRAARIAVYRDLYASGIVYTVLQNGVSSVVAAAPGLQLGGSGNVLRLALGPKSQQPNAPVACLTRARAWPTSFAAGGGAMSWTGGDELTVGVQAVASPSDAGRFQWTYRSAASASTTSVADSTATPYAGSLLCLPALQSSDAGGLATITGLVIGSGYSGTGTAMQPAGTLMPVVV